MKKKSILLFIALVGVFLTQQVFGSLSIEVQDIAFEPQKACHLSVNSRSVIVAEKKSQTITQGILYVKNITKIQNNDQHYDICEVVISESQVGRKPTQSIRTFIKDRNVNKASLTAPQTPPQVHIKKQIMLEDTQKEHIPFEEQKPIEGPSPPAIEQSPQPRVSFWRWLLSLFI